MCPPLLCAPAPAIPAARRDSGAPGKVEQISAYQQGSGAGARGASSNLSLSASVIAKLRRCASGPPTPWDLADDIEEEVFDEGRCSEQLHTMRMITVGESVSNRSDVSSLTPSNRFLPAGHGVGCEEGACLEGPLLLSCVWVPATHVLTHLMISGFKHTAARPAPDGKEDTVYVSLPCRWVRFCGRNANSRLSYVCELGATVVV